jgi:uncharacterized hydrophobic protein (TIGR00271 family)
VLELRAYATADRVSVVVQRLSKLSGVHHVVAGGFTARGMVRITAELQPDVADVVLDLLRDSELSAEDVSLWRANTIQVGPLRRDDGRHPTVWAEVIGRAGEHARLAVVYVLYMAAAGVVAGVGVLTGSAILVVGAMALSPDLLPISAAAVGLVERRWRLTARALVTLVLGLAVVTVAAMVATLVLRLSGRIEQSLALADTVLGPSLTDVGPGSVLVALAAGMAGMLAYETASGAAVGVAISVTTIPAAAYVGDAIGLGGREDGAGALSVLGTNVVCIEVAAALTLLVQRRRRQGRQADRAPGVAGDHPKRTMTGRPSRSYGRCVAKRR